MTLPRRAPGSLALLALALVGPGCAQFQWSFGGPGAPGHKNAVSDANIPTTTTLPDLDQPAPFSASEQETITPIQPTVEQVARTHGLDPDLVNAIIWVESRFDPRARSPAGARGLMQLMPATAAAMARQMGHARPRVYDPEFNVEAGSLYLLGLLDRFDGDEILALAAYNAGAGNVSRWMREDGELPPRSLEYVDHVQRARLRFVALRESEQPDQERTMLASAPAPAPAPAPAEPSVTGPAREPIPAREPTPTRAAADPPVNPLAPSPDVYRPEPTPEPPLKDTPYPPVESRRATAEPDEVDPLPPPGTLPSVLD